MRPGELIAGRYELVERLGRGGMGEVWTCKDTKLRRDVAVKLLALDDAASPDASRRFELEAVAAAQINHPNVARSRSRIRRPRAPRSTALPSSSPPSAATSGPTSTRWAACCSRCSPGSRRTPVTTVSPWYDASSPRTRRPSSRSVKASRPRSPGWSRIYSAASRTSAPRRRPRSTTASSACAPLWTPSSWPTLRPSTSRASTHPPAADFPTAATGPSGRRTFPWADIKTVSLEKILSHTGYRHSGLHLAFSRKGPRPERPAGWSYRATPVTRNDGHTPVCVLGPLGEQEHAELTAALTRYGGSRWRPEID